MMMSLPRLGSYVIICTLFIVCIFHFKSLRDASPFYGPSTAVYRRPQDPHRDPNQFDWGRRKEHFPVAAYHPIPRPSIQELPKVQYDFDTPAYTALATRRQRQAQIKGAMKRSWEAYRRQAWLMDELAPISGGNKTTYGGWAATLVDSLDTLWIMDMMPEFKEAVDAVVEIDFTGTTMETINLFETTIRYLGGFLSAYDLCGDKRLLDKSLELADMIYAAFDTPNRLPILRWDFHAAASGQEQVSAENIILAEIGSLSLEFTRLSQITNDAKWYDAIARIMAVFDDQQDKSVLPGMWPLTVNGGAADFASGDIFSLAAFSDSMYEYLPKMYALLGGSAQYEKMYKFAMATYTKHGLYRPMIKQEGWDLLAPGTIRVKDGGVSIQPELQHLVCFVGGMLALGGRLFQDESHVELGRKVTNTCIWAYKAHKTGIMSENQNLVPCPNVSQEPCEWDEERWHAAVVNDAMGEERLKNATTLIKQERLPVGMSAVSDRRYHLRPEAIESIFVLYRTTGDEELQERAWTMFRSIYAHTRTDWANAAIEDVTNSTAPKLDNMESFWTAETLKYFYLTFSDPKLISLDDWTFNTEAHPFKRPSMKSSGWMF